MHAAGQVRQVRQVLWSLTWKQVCIRLYRF
jgi:hypothetical protein